ncbi:MAG: hypothetical protein A2Z91_04970 [Deltaproteobacteria bacterium GWA2_38_16]|nr:MAG: hypothetical protein A2Z91_04970 [Deltaproteobacteria bacterium GWA2_38_16]OGQ03133.1 MAG: hypothetical protein A3D19_03700 [Deltaproteobacteria bacterium RIFCSPHIGHO2_02_FULL_38_15]OGQ30016.1 MAG: hypothetical protein A3A72_09060 [Deltaproteobacteria bacterium RIFCSPLOWO2_01_FULL_38_9]OGQ61733.1 MAG: hypothetical protein A3G92_01720 [Deltaproteobacteria bacterium RIFCSPLOWO2_12_FULL_38_8]HBQ20446.1 hypothetical protein [Deltaproteobacteria bacterium]
MIFEHTDYKSYLKEAYIQKKNANSKYSQRAFAKHLGISPTLINLVFKGTKNISSETALMMSDPLKLKENERDYFCSLVQLEGAKTPQAKEFMAKKLENLHPAQSFQTIELDHFKMISNWYHHAILEMTELDHFKYNPSWISKTLNISKEEVELAWERLKRLKLITKKKGKWHKTHAFSSIQSDKYHDVIRKFHKQTLEKALESLSSQTPEEMEMGTMTLSIDPSKIKQAKKKMKEFRMEMAQYLTKGKRTHTYQLSTHLFKLTKGDSRE